MVSLTIPVIPVVVWARLPPSGSNFYGREKIYIYEGTRKSDPETRTPQLIQRLSQGIEEEEEEDGKWRGKQLIAMQPDISTSPGFFSTVSGFPSPKVVQLVVLVTAGGRWLGVGE